MADKTMNARRVARVTRLTEELGHADVIDALKQAIEMRTALRVIHTWCAVHDAFNQKDIRNMCAKALKIEQK